ncbi:MAG: hypothetical protein KDC76_13445 [Bacteroidetes bacterium]|nr:hypothetical protein [Bacteroidota bacterium]
MNKIDDIFKSGLDGKGANSSAEQWAEMSALLDAKKGAGMFTSLKWIAPVVLVIGVLLWAIWPVNDLSVGNDEKSGKSGHNEKRTSGMAMENSTGSASGYVDDHTLKPTKVDASNDGNSNYKSESAEHVQPPSPTGKSGQSGSTPRAEKSADNMSWNPQTPMASTPTNDKVEDQSSEPKQGDFNFLPINLNPRNRIDLFRYSFGGLQLKKQTHLPLNLNHSWSIFLSPAIDLGYTNRKLDVNHISDLKSTEKALIKPNVGLDVVFKKNHLALKIGIGQINLSEQTNYSLSNTEWSYDTSFVLVERNFRKAPNGKFAALLEKQIDSTGSTSQVVACQDCEVAFRYVTVPLAVQYEFHRNRFIYFLELGGSVWLLRSASGSYVTHDQQSPEQSDVIMNIQNRVGLIPKTYQINSGVGLKYRIATNMNVTANYRYTHSLNSMLTNYHQQVRMHRLGIGLEVRLWEL